MTKCWSCGNWDSCYKFLYGNNKQDYMKNIDKIIDDWGEPVIRVYECEKFRKVPQDLPICIAERLHKKENDENSRIYDIMKEVENYLYNSGK